MATPGSPQGHNQAGSDNAQEHQQAPQVQDGHYEYHNTGMAETISTKTGHEQTGYVECERPVSASTANGTEYYFDKFSEADDDIEDIVARNMVTPGMAASQAPSLAEPTAASNFFTKPYVSDGIDTNESFQFGKPSHQQMQFRMTRQPPVSNGRMTPESVGRHVEYHGVTLPTEMEGATGTQASLPESTPSFPTNDTTAEQFASPCLANERKRKKKNQKIQSRQRLIDEAPNEVAVDTAMAGPLDAPDDVAGADNDHGVDVQPAVLGIDQLHEGHGATRRQHSNRESSPHEQLQGDLDMAAQDQQNRFNECSTILVHGSQDNADELRAASPVVDNQGIVEQQNVLPDDQADVEGQQTARASGQAASMRVQKKKSKSARKTTSARRTQSAGLEEWKVSDYGRLFLQKVDEYEELEQAREAAFASEREAMQMKLQQSIELKTAMQSNLNGVLAESEQLTITIDQQKRKIITYENKFQSFKKFVDGVGKDIDAMRKDSNTLRRRSDDIIAEVAEVEGRMTRQSAKFDEVNGHINDCQKIKREAVKLAREKDEKLHRTVLHRDQLQQQLGDTAGVLSEQRDRCAKLERQLQESEKKFIDSLEVNQKNHNAMLDQLHLTHAAVEDEQSKGGATKMIEQLRSAAEAIGSPANSAIQGVAGVKALVEALDEKLNRNIETTEATEVSIRKYFDEAWKAVAAQLSDREKLIEDHHNVVGGLQEQLKASNSLIASEEVQKTAAIEQVGVLKQQNAALQTKVSALQSKTSPGENANVQLNETKLELEKTVTTLSATKADLDSKAEQLKTLTLANNSLGDQIKALQDRLHGIQSNNDDSMPTHILEGKLKEAEERTRKKMAARIENFELELKTKSNNELKKLHSEKNRLEKKIKPLQDEIASYKQQMNAAQIEKPAASEALKQELERTRKHNETQKSELESLQSTVKNLKQASVDGSALQEKLATLSVQLDAEQSKLRHTSERSSGLQEQVKRLDDAREELELEKEETMQELSNLRMKSDSRVTTLQKDLDEARDNASRSNAGLEAFKRSCDDVVKAANKDNDRKLQALQKQLTETQAELQSAREENETFFEGVEQSWKDEQEGWRNKVADATKETTDMQASKAEAVAACESVIQQLRAELDQQRLSMQEENDNLQTQLQAAEEKSQAHQRPSSKETKSSSRIQVPRVSDGKTPSTQAASATSKQPRAPSKSIDRTKSEITQAGPIQTPEELRPDSRKTNSANSKAATKGPVVEETQFVTDPFAVHQSQAAAVDHTQDSFSSLIHDYDIGVKDNQPQPTSPETPETQPEDSIPTFAAFKRSVRPSQANMPFLSSVSNGLTRVLQSSDSATDGLPEVKTVKGPQHNGNRQSEQSGLHSARATSNLQMRPWSEEEKKKYTYHPPVPESNSASKRAPELQPPSRPVKRRESGTGSRADRYKTPILDTQTSNEFGKQMPSSSGNGSSPAFIKDANTNRRFTTYGTPGNLGGKHHASRTGSELIQDPRLAGRDQAAGTKRRSTGQVVDGYEEERKKRLAMDTTGMNEFERSTHVQHPQSISDLPSSNRGTTRRSSQTHMQTFGGGDSRTTRRTARGHGADEMSARFTREVQRRR